MARRKYSDESQVVAVAAVYSAYGNLEVEYGTSCVPGFGFAGQYRYYADATGLDYLQARYYHPAVGRFVSRDTIGYKGGLNLYGYAYGNPIMRMDPTGTIAPWLAAILAKAALGCAVGAIGGGGPEIVNAVIDYFQGEPVPGGVGGVACRAGINGACGCVLGAIGALPFVGETARAAIVAAIGGAVGGSVCSQMAASICPCK